MKEKKNYGCDITYATNNELGFDKTIQTGVISKEDRTMKLSELCDSEKYTEVSFMVFRTGSCLIVGNCNDDVLLFVYEFIKQMLHDEYTHIYVVNTDTNAKIKTKKIRKKQVSMTKGYMNNVLSNDIEFQTYHSES